MIQFPLFYDELKAALATAQTLQEAEEIIQKEIGNISGKKIGFVVGKVSPVSPEETKKENLAVLEKRTREIAEKEVTKGIIIFSSSVIPPVIENSAIADEFYIFWENIIQKYVAVFYTTPGYEVSKGAVKEVKIGKRMGKKIWSYENTVQTKS